MPVYAYTADEEKGKAACPVEVNWVLSLKYERKEQVSC
jgi:hypothetical protein